MGRRITHEEDLQWNEVVGFRISERRNELGKTQSWLAQNASLSAKVLCEIECGKTGVCSHVLYRIARALCCDMGYFYAPIRTAESVKF